jgi:hypothetical protein
MKRIKVFMKSFITFITVVILFMAVSTTPVHAATGNIAGHSAVLIAKSIKREDSRVTKLKAYLESRNSPLAPYAENFVREADANNLDWKFVVSISGVESGYGKHIPAGSYNGWGWGYRNGTVMHFSSWDEAITTISHDLRSKYIERGGAKDIYGIGAIYAANPQWANRVLGFMNKLDTYEVRSETLPISI